MFRVLDKVCKPTKGSVHSACVDLTSFKIDKGDKVAQIMLCEHKTHLFGIETEAERKGGFGSTGN